MGFPSLKLYAWLTCLVSYEWEERVSSQIETPRSWSTAATGHQYFLRPVERGRVRSDRRRDSRRVRVSSCGAALTGSAPHSGQRCSPAQWNRLAALELENTSHRTGAACQSRGLALPEYCSTSHVVRDRPVRFRARRRRLPAITALPGTVKPIACRAAGSHRKDDPHPRAPGRVQKVARRRRPAACLFHQFLLPALRHTVVVY
jgi:hypothetical protein